MAPRKLAQLSLVLLFAGIGLAGGAACKKKKDNPATTTNTNTTAPKKRVFVKYPLELDGDLGGLAGADAICQTAADGADLGGTWKAWLSDETTNAKDRIADVGPWYLPNKTTKVFDSKAKLLNPGTPLVAIDRDQDNTHQTGGFQVWTGTLVGGVKSSSNTCNGWSGTAGVGAIGFHDQTDADWTDDSGGSQGCANNGHLYCFEQ